MPFQSSEVPCSHSPFYPRASGRFGGGYGVAETRDKNRRYSERINRKNRDILKNFAPLGILRSEKSAMELREIGTTTLVARIAATLPIERLHFSSIAN